MSKNASFFMPVVSLFGANVLSELAGRVKSLGGKKPLVVTDKGMTQLGYTKQVTDLLDQADIAYAVFDETIPNPTDKNVEQGVDAYQKGQCDMLISLGGGSAHDCCKGVGLVVSNGGVIADYEGVDQSKNSLPPYIAINTTGKWRLWIGASRRTWQLMIRC